MIQIPFNNIEKTETADAFLKKQPVNSLDNTIQKKLNYLEYLLDPNFNAVDLRSLQKALSHYASIITENDDAHQLALEKYTRLVCLYIFKTQSINEISRIQKNLEQYFPFYVGNTAKPAWLARYIENAKMPVVLDTLFKRGSYQIKIGQFGANKHVLENISIDALLKSITTLSQHDLYTTHQTTAYNVVNALTRATSYIPFANVISSATQAIVGNVSLEINTSRQTTLKNYATAVNRLYGFDFKHLPKEEKEAHVELLFFFYSNGNESLQKDIALRMDNLINEELDNDTVLLAVLKAIAPEPLGMGWYGLTSHPDILAKLTPKATMVLLNTAMGLCDEDECNDYHGMIKSALANDRENPIPFTFNQATSNNLEWLAYILCMGTFRATFKIEINYEAPTHRQKLLVQSLMQSNRLMISANQDVNEVALVRNPNCDFKNISTKEVILSNTNREALILPVDGPSTASGSRQPLKWSS